MANTFCGMECEGGKRSSQERLEILNYLLTYLLSYLLTLWSRVFLEKLAGFQLVKKFPAFYGTRRFITAFTSPHHLSLP